MCLKQIRVLFAMGHDVEQHVLETHLFAIVAFGFSKNASKTYGTSQQWTGNLKQCGAGSQWICVLNQLSQWPKHIQHIWLIIGCCGVLVSREVW